MRMAFDFTDAIDRQAIVDHLRRGLATPADGLIPPIARAHEPGITSYAFDPVRARGGDGVQPGREPHVAGPHDRGRGRLGRG